MSGASDGAVPQLITSASELRRLVAAARRAGHTVGLVPTMGALHPGHLSLVERSRAECDLTIVTIFVNPTQFGPGEDFSKYPRTLESDMRLLQGHPSDVVFSPAADTVYRPGHATSVEVEGPALPLEGQFRPGHFRGVATIVLKLFNLAQADRAYFGRKDFQQALVVRRMIEDLDVPTELVVCPIVREADGLAMSSRNVYLSADERQRALSIRQSLLIAQQMFRAGERNPDAILARMRAMLLAADLKIDYVALADPQTLEMVTSLTQPTVALIAARVGATRLIDNEWIE